MSTNGSERAGAGRPLRIAILVKRATGVSETFIRQQIARLPGTVLTVEGADRGVIPKQDGRPVWAPGKWYWIFQKIGKKVGCWKTDDRLIAQAYARFFRREEIDIVIAQYGMLGAAAAKYCSRMNIPLITFFRGFDATRVQLLEEWLERYRQLFRVGDAFVAVSHDIEARLMNWGALPERIHYIPSGVDCDAFSVGRPDMVGPGFLAVGRFVEKKAPHLSILAFKEVHERYPEARLTMIGDGPLLPVCCDLAKVLGLEETVTFRGAQSHEVVCAELQQARGFVQHSVTAASGDAEGTPNSLKEASASGLPVVSTLHAGVPEIVEDGVTGFLVAERDVSGMAEKMGELIEDPELARTMGLKGRARMEAQFSITDTMALLEQLIRRLVPRCEANGTGENVRG